MERVLFAPRELPPLGPDVAHDVAAYDGWIRAREEQRIEQSKRRRPRRGIPGSPLRLVMAVSEAPASSIERTLRGLLAQTSRHWSLTTVCAADRSSEVGRLMGRVLPRRHRRRVRCFSGAPTGVADQVWRGIGEVRGAPFALVFPGDLWARDAVALLCRSLTPDGVVYGDHDVLAPDGRYVSPRLKPDYSPDLLLSDSYIGAPLVIGPAVAARIVRPVGTRARTIEHELALGACESASSVDHVAEVLCHRSPSETDETEGHADGHHLRVVLDRRHDEAEVRPGRAPDTFRILRRAEGSVSIVIPFRDEPQLLRTCVDSVTATTQQINTEFLLVDNGSTDPETATLLEQLGARKNVYVMADPRPFNWAALNNAAAKRANGDVLLFLNNDIEAFRTGWLPTLLGHARRPDIGAVGARLLYPDHRLQHCGIVVGLVGAAGHPLIGLHDGEAGYMNMAVVTRECSAVTGACLATRREVFAALNGFDESHGVDLNDVDYCLRGSLAGYRTIYEPEAELIHHESPSRGTAGGAGDIVKFIARWKDYISNGDPYFNNNLTRSNPWCGLASPTEKERWNAWYSTLAA